MGKVSEAQMVFLRTPGRYVRGHYNFPTVRTMRACEKNGLIRIVQTIPGSPTAYEVELTEAGRAALHEDK